MAAPYLKPYPAFLAIPINVPSIINEQSLYPLTPGVFLKMWPHMSEIASRLPNME